MDYFVNSAMRLYNQLKKYNVLTYYDDTHSFSSPALKTVLYAKTSFLAR